MTAICFEPEILLSARGAGVRELPASNAAAVASTAHWIAAARAHEGTRRNHLFDDPFASALVERLEDDERRGRSASSSSLVDRLILRTLRTFGHPYLAIRTRFFDDFLLQAVHHAGVRQVVILAAGMDARAFRLTWPSDVRLYELDRPDVLAAKDDALRGVQVGCQRHSLGADLTHSSWEHTLRDAGYEVSLPAVWLIEGLLMYLDAVAVHTLLRTVTRLAAEGSWLAGDLFNTGVLTSPFLRPWLQALATYGAPWCFATDTPEALFAAHGWRASVSQPGEEGADYGRWPFPAVPRERMNCPRIFLITAQRDCVTETRGKY